MATYCSEDGGDRELFSCPICFEDYDLQDVRRAPKLLLCLHTFCYECTQKLWKKDGSLECSMCRMLHEKVILEDLFDNHVIIQYLQREREQQDLEFARKIDQELRNEFGGSPVMVSENNVVVLEENNDTVDEFSGTIEILDSSDDHNEMDETDLAAPEETSPRVSNMDDQDVEERFVEMVRNYMPRGGPKQPKTYTEEDLKEAVRRVNGGEQCKRVARLLHIPHRTLRNHISSERKTSTGVASRQKALLPEEELTIAQHIATFADFGYAFERQDLKFFVQSFLNKAGRNCPVFKENVPGDEWVRSFLDRHKGLLSQRACQNINRKRAAVSCEAVNKFFNNLEVTLAGVSPDNILNYDETNLTDDPKAKLMIFRKGTKHAERIMNTSKTSVSIMFACSATGKFLPPYTVYKAERMMDTWILGGPIGARYNRTKSGWFDGFCFRDWLVEVAVPYFRRLDNEAPRVLIGDNLACHLSADIIEICEANNLKMLFLPPNSTHLLQPLDVAVYGPMKAEWRKVITEWKVGEGRFHTTLPKNVFPRLLFKLMINMDHKEDFAVNGFKTTGIHPLQRHKVIDKLTRTDVSPSSQHLVSPMVLERLTELREASAKKPGAIQRGKAVQVSPGKSVSWDDIAAGPSGSKSQPKRIPKRKLYIESSDDSTSSSDEADDLDKLPSSEGEMEPDASPEGSQEVSNSAPDASPGELEEGSYVIVRFEGKKTPYHYVGKLVNKDDNTGNTWNIQYFRFCFDASSPHCVSFKYPQNPDFFITDSKSIVKLLPKPLVERQKLVFKRKDIGDWMMR